MAAGDPKWLQNKSILCKYVAAVGKGFRMTRKIDSKNITRIRQAPYSCNRNVEILNLFSYKQTLENDNGIGIDINGTKG